MIRLTLFDTNARPVLARIRVPLVPTGPLPIVPSSADQKEIWTLNPMAIVTWVSEVRWHWEPRIVLNKWGSHESHVPFNGVHINLIGGLCHHVPSILNPL